MITSDSLAAESMQSGGDFALDGRKAGISGQPSRGSTANVTDISNATVLDPAPAAEARQATEEWNESAILNSGLGQGKAAGRGPTWDIPDSSTSNNAAQPASSGLGSNSDFNSSIDAANETPGKMGKSKSANVAPSYANADQQSTGGVMKPKGRNIHEGGFDDSAPNASFNNEIGTKNDPARFAENQLEERNARNAADSGYARDMNTANEGQYDALKEESA